MATSTPSNTALTTFQQNIKSIVELVGENEKLAQIALKPFKKVIQNLQRQKETQEEAETDCMIIEPPKKKAKCKEERKKMQKKTLQ